ncbi:MAG: Acetyltransferase domain [Paenibacillus sp.]|jgi:ribosomal protein S18 acetylase RimI-like enzyme|nr:Acetyltransferase domain [Paenibacillus sp.]
MGTHPEYRDQGLGTQLMNYFIEHVRTLGFKLIMLLTVPSEVKPIYEHTIKFYEKHDFKITKKYTEVWGSGAIEMTRHL